MNRLQKGLVGIVLSGLMAVSGCGSIFGEMKIGGYEPVDLSKSRYAADIEKKADELAKSDNERDRKNAIEAYGSLGLLEEMDENIKWLNNKNSSSGRIYSGFGDKFYKMHKK